MKKGPLLLPDDVHLGASAIVAPPGDGDVSRGAGLGSYPASGMQVRLTEAHVAAARRGALLIYALPEPVPAEPAPAAAPAAPAPAAAEPVKEDADADRG